MRGSDETKKGSRRSIFFFVFLVIIIAFVQSMKVAVFVATRETQLPHFGV